MNGSALKVVPQVNLDEFERRLMAAGAPAGAQEDPLDELARLVGLDANAGKPAAEATAAQPPAPPARLPHIDEQTGDIGGFAQLLRIDFGDVRSDVQGAPSHESGGHGAPEQREAPPDDVAPAEGAPQQAAQWAADSPPPPRRSGRAKLRWECSLASARPVSSAPGRSKWRQGCRKRRQ